MQIAIQTVSNLPSGTSAPSTLITEYAVRTYHLPTHLDGWLIQAPAPLTASQIRAARHVAGAYDAPLEIASGGPDLGEIAGAGTALGIVLALGVLAASVGLIRSETARDLRTLTAVGASSATRLTRGRSLARAGRHGGSVPGGPASRRGRAWPGRIWGISPQVPPPSSGREPCPPGQRHHVRWRTTIVSCPILAVYEGCLVESRGRPWR